MATFLPFTTRIELPFWKAVNEKKLHEWKLDESPKPILGQLSYSEITGKECSLLMTYKSFNTNEIPKQESISGFMHLYNTAESFKAAMTAESKKKILEDETAKIWDSITSHAWLKNPELLSKFFMITFVDLKKFKYFSITCVPGLYFPSEIQQEINKDDLYGADPKTLFSHMAETSSTVFLFCRKSATILEVSHLESVNNPDDFAIVVADPSTVSYTAGWPVRNVLAAVAQLHSSWNHCHVISLRSTGSIGIKFMWTNNISSQEKSLNFVPKSAGWDKLYNVDLRQKFDPVLQVDNSVNLNNELMKWRQLPDIRLERYSKLKVWLVFIKWFNFPLQVLILGAGTIGCNVARGLIAWGVSHITFVDNSTVSYSNPVRQSLSEFEDAKNDRGKAETAAKALIRINPNTKAEAHMLTVPMPGHTIDKSAEAQLEKDVQKLEQLVMEHDVVYLALDSREARWLPTVLATKHRKIAISVAIGFDTFVVIRHGIGSRSDSLSHEAIAESMPYSHLSCYFCSDVTAPGNSTADRTLDQQCTVTRAGMSPQASAVATELLASILQYPDPLMCPASVDENTTMLGATPHQIRYFANRYQMILPIVKRFERCVACGDAIAKQYQQHGWKFVLDVMNSPSRLEQVTGLDALQESVNAIDIEFDEDEDTTDE
ncbi:hypothetical protein CAEBREN_05797 [Caenorhabditis brenneri]|uniref:Ubiquitin-like modifier-activating enzyme ATG7 n=1 Tax=Caenorhabditis brenneri TaxID=135651 RepID=G0PB43_CAEBE|nr:hypothetical protein CAEBREN_05797 [Caenorhabditis brenneri]